MKFFKFSLAINPLYRDLALVAVVGMLASAALVTMGYIILAQAVR